jgi:hypothetical protein
MFLRCELNVPVTFNNIFHDNQANAGDDLYLLDNDDTLLIAYSNIDPVNVAGNSPWIEFENINEDPGFVDDSCHIDEASPCVNTGGDSLLYKGYWYYCPSYDFEGEDRPFPSIYCDPIPDIGAYEIEIDCESAQELDTQHSTLNIKHYPNPTRGIVNCRFSVVDCQYVSVAVFDVHGREVATVLNKKLPAGEHVVQYDATDLPAGVYLVRVCAGRESSVGKLVVQ